MTLVRYLSFYKFENKANKSTEEDQKTLKELKTRVKGLNVNIKLCEKDLTVNELNKPLKKVLKTPGPDGIHDEILKQNKRKESTPLLHQPNLEMTAPIQLKDCNNFTSLKKKQPCRAI